MKWTATTMRRLTAALFALLTLLVLSRTAAAQGHGYDSLYVFGDSIVDVGNDFILTSILRQNPAVPPSVSPHRTYFEGRFSNGPVVSEYLWQMISGNAPGSNQALKPLLASPALGRAVDFAFGGTGTPLVDQTPGGLFAPGLKGQVELFRVALRGQKPSKRALCVIVSGTNDYRLDAFNQPMDPQEVVQNIVDAITTLYRTGVRNVMVLSLPDLTKLPANFTDNQDQLNYLTALTNAHNAQFFTAMSALQATYPSLHLIPVDINAVSLPVTMIKDVPALAAFDSLGLLPPHPPGFPIAACLFIDPATCVDAPLSDQTANAFEFWDIVHPTTAAHYLLAQYLFALLP
jgi:phospholipase/lecithinase/hemolysin